MSDQKQCEQGVSRKTPFYFILILFIQFKWVVDWENVTKCHSRSESYWKQENATSPPYFARSIVQCRPAYLIYAHLINIHLILLTLYMLTIYVCSPIYSPYICSPYLCSPYMYAHLIYKVHSADSKTDKGALHQSEKPNSGEIQPFNQKGRRMLKGFEAKLL